MLWDEQILYVVSGFLLLATKEIQRNNMIKLTFHVHLHYRQISITPRSIKTGCDTNTVCCRVTTLTLTCTPPSELCCCVMSLTWAQTDPTSVYCCHFLNFNMNLLFKSLLLCHIFTIGCILLSSSVLKTIPNIKTNTPYISSLLCHFFNFNMNAPNQKFIVVSRLYNRMRPFVFIRLKNNFQL